MSSWLSNLFGKKYISTNQNYVDLHSHLIPGIDDGSQSIEESIKLIRGLSDLGYKKIITTPHIMPGNFNNTPEIILSGLEKLKKQLDNEGINTKIEAAAEYYLDENFLKNIQNDNLITFGENYVLFELPSMSKPPHLEEAIFELTLKGYKPILAHPERYLYMHDKNLSQYETLRPMGLLYQINMLSLIGYYSKPIERVAKELINRGMVDLIGSDMHNEKHLSLLPEVFNTKHYNLLLDSGDLQNNNLLN